MSAPRITESNRYPVAVYGTLRPGFGNDRWTWQGRADAEEGGVVDGYRLTTNGAFPYASPAEGESTVITLIHPYPDEYVAVLDRMDGLEGVRYDDEPEGFGGHYSRTEVTVRFPGHTTTAWLYTVPPSRGASMAVPDNDWSKWGTQWAPPAPWQTPDGATVTADYEDDVCLWCGDLEENHSDEELDECAAQMALVNGGWATDEAVDAAMATAPEGCLVREFDPSQQAIS